MGDRVDLLTVAIHESHPGPGVGRVGVGSRRSAWSTIALITAGMSSVTLAFNHLPVATGPRLRPGQRRRGEAGMMSLMLRGTGSTSYTATTSAIRLRPCFSPGLSRVASFPLPAFAAARARNMAVREWPKSL